jgi:hypothetical protein
LRVDQAVGGKMVRLLQSLGVEAAVRTITDCEHQAGENRANLIWRSNRRGSRLPGRGGNTMRSILTIVLSRANSEGDQWQHELKYDGYPMHARLRPRRGEIADAHRRHKYPAIAKAVAALDVRQRYSTGNYPTPDPTASPPSTSSSSRRTAAIRQQSPSSCSIFSTLTARISPAATDRAEEPPQHVARGHCAVPALQ